MTAARHPYLRRRIAAVFTTLALAAVAAACTTTVNPFPPPGSTPQPAVGSATAGTVASVIRMLDEAGLQAEVTSTPFRPFEGPLLAAAPRTVIGVDLPDDPQGAAFVVVYAFRTADAAMAAATDHAAYLAAGIGGLVQYPPGTRFTIQVSKSNVVFFSWLPATSPDSRTPTIEETLRSLDVSIEVPS